MVFVCLLLYFFLRKIAEDGCSLSRWCISTVCDSENLLSIGESFLKWNRDRIVVRIPSLTVAKESRAHKWRNYTIYELLFSF